MISILDNHPVPDHFSVSNAHESRSRIPVPHNLSVVASAKIFGDVVLSIASRGWGGLQELFSDAIKTQLISYTLPFLFIHSINVVAQSFTFQGCITLQYLVGCIAISKG